MELLLYFKICVCMYICDCMCVNWCMHGKRCLQRSTSFPVLCVHLWLCKCVCKAGFPSVKTHFLCVHIALQLYYNVCERVYASGMSCVPLWKYPSTGFEDLFSSCICILYCNCMCVSVSMHQECISANPQAGRIPTSPGGTMPHLCTPLEGTQRPQLAPVSCNPQDAFARLAMCISLYEVCLYTHLLIHSFFFLIYACFNQGRDVVLTISSADSQ